MSTRAALLVSTLGLAACRTMPAADEAGSEPPAAEERGPAAEPEGAASATPGEGVLEGELVRGLTRLMGGEVEEEPEEGEGEGDSEGSEVLVVGDPEGLAELGERAPALPEVLLVELEVDGPDPAAAQRVIEARLRSVVDCAAEADAREVSIALRLVLTLEIASTGKVTRAALEGELEARLRSCIERAASRWRFGSEAPGQARLRLQIEAPRERSFPRH